MATSSESEVILMKRERLLINAKKYILPISLYVFVFIIWPVLDREYFKVFDGFGYLFFPFVFQPVAIFIASTYFTYKYGYDYYHTIIMLVIFIISIYLIFNVVDILTVFVPINLIIDYLGILIGLLMRKYVSSK